MTRVLRIIIACLLIGIVAAVALDAGVAWYQSAAYQRMAEARTSSPITAIRIQVHPLEDDWLHITDENETHQVVQWLRSAEYPGLASWPGANCDVVIVFEDGSQEQLRVSILSNHSNYATLEWGGYFMIAADVPAGILKKITPTE